MASTIPNGGPKTTNQNADFAPAMVIPNRGSRVWDCFVRDITSLGARLEFQMSPSLRWLFILTFDAKTLRSWLMVWRNADEVGVTKLKEFSVLRTISLSSLLFAATAMYA